MSKMARPIRRTTPPTLRVLNWGWGQDSTTLALMAHHGEIPPFDAILSADTQAEPAEVYETVEWVMSILTTPCYRVTAGNLETNILAVSRDPSAKRTPSQPPFYVQNPPNADYATPVRGGKLWRECTQGSKIGPIRQKIREILGVKATGPLPQGIWVEQAIGFPLDEIGRAFCSDVQWITNTFPLIMKGMRKRDCARWLTEHGYPIPPKSSCRFCPFHSNAYWRRMRDTQPHEWAKACAFEAELHKGKLPGVRGIPYLHKSMVPLPMAPIDEPDTGQEELFCYACSI